MSDKVLLIEDCFCQHCGDITSKWWSRYTCCFVGCCRKCRINGNYRRVPFLEPHKCLRPNVFDREIGL